MATEARHIFSSLVAKGEWTVVQYVLEKEKHNIDINQDIKLDFDDDRCGVSFPLLLACGSGNDIMAEQFISLGAEINKQDSTGTTALMVASQGGHKSVVQLLLKWSADINLGNNTGQTALMFASSEGYVEIVELFLNGTQEVLIDKSDKNGMTALMLAVFHGHVEVVRLLRQKFATVQLDCRLVLGVNAGDVAKAKGHHNVLAELSTLPDHNSCSTILPLDELARILDIVVRDTDRNNAYLTRDGEHQPCAKDKNDPCLPTLDVTFRLFAPISHWWENIALHLKLSDYEIRSVKQLLFGNPETCFQDYLREMLRACFAKECPTWKVLEDVIISLFPESQSSQRDRLIDHLHQAMPENLSTGKNEEFLHSGARQTVRVIEKKLELRNVLRLTFPLAAQWKNLGVFLGIDKDNLDAIEHNCHHISENCLRETIHAWLKKGENILWTDLSKAVEPLDPKLAEDILKHSREPFSEQ